ncbi:MAG: hypothetical protein ACU84Q_08625 [Gammaproteobacteria bacterium]
MSSTLALLRFFFEMCLLKKNPQQSPNSTFLLRLLVLSNIAINFLINVATTPFPVALILAVLAIILVYGFTSTLLWTLKYSARARQTLTSIFGTDLIIAGPAIGLRYWLQWLQESGQQSEIAILLWVVVFIWNLIVTAHIFRHAIDKPFGIGVIAAIGYSVIVFNVMYAAHDWLLSTV